MEYDINIRISNRHVHLTKEVYDLLFDDEMQVESPLNQIGQFVSNKTVTLETPSWTKEGVKVLGPNRDYTQVEISKNDARKFNINPPVRESGHLEGAEVITIKTEKGSVSLPCCIIAERHIHMSLEDARKYGVQNHQKVKLQIFGEKPGVIEVYTSVSDTGFFETHVDTDDGNAFLIQDGDKGKMIL